MAFCALCLSEGLELVMRPLGRDDALVAVCHGCDEEPAVEGHGVERGYEPPTSEGATAPMVASAHRKAFGDKPKSRGRVLARTPRPGFLLIRLARRKYDDATAARSSFRDEPWFAELKYLGCDDRYFLFERPDTEACAAARRASNFDPIAALTKFGGGRG